MSGSTDRNVLCLLRHDDWWSFPHQAEPMAVSRSLQKPLLVVKGKQVENLRGERTQAILRSTATGWWSQSPRAALRMASMWRYVAAPPPSPPSFGLTGPLHLSVRHRGSEGYGGPNQLLGWRSEFPGGWTERKRSEPRSSVVVWWRWPLTPGTQLHEADEEGPFGLLLPQQLQGAGDSRTHEGESGLWRTSTLSCRLS